MKVDVMLGNSAKADTKEQVVHNMALDNFCLLAFKVGGMTRFEYSQFPPKRTVRFFLFSFFFFGERRLIVRCMVDYVLIDSLFKSISWLQVFTLDEQTQEWHIAETNP